jgi:hypothetical protein
MAGPSVACSFSIPAISATLRNDFLAMLKRSAAGSHRRTMKTSIVR